MNRPEVRVIEDQDSQINDNPQINSWEAEQLLRKYGYEETSYSSNQETNITQTNNLTFEEMIEQENQRLKEERIRKEQQLKGPKPISYDGVNGYHSETRYSSDDDSGFGFKVEITSDMPIPKY